MDNAKIKETAAKIVEGLDESVQFNILAQEDFTLEVEYPEDWDGEEYSDEDMAQLHKEIRALLKPRCYIKCDNWHLFYYEYMLFCDLEDDDALADNLEAFEVPSAWRIRVRRKTYELVGHEPLGFMFVKVPKRAAAQFEAALDNYLRRMEWKHHGFTQLALEALADILNEPHNC